jgi:hypothetical protein
MLLAKLMFIKNLHQKIITFCLKCVSIIQKNITFVVAYHKRYKNIH